jgi:hypothetical protein
MTLGLDRTRFQTRFFIAAFSSAVIALAVAGILFATIMRRQTDERIERTSSAARDSPRSFERLTAFLSSHLDERRIARPNTRVTFVAADGRVMGDSSETLRRSPLPTTTGSDPEIVEAAARG